MITFPDNEQRSNESPSRVVTFSFNSSGQTAALVNAGVNAIEPNSKSVKLSTLDLRRLIFVKLTQFINIFSLVTFKWQF